MIIDCHTHLNRYAPEHPDTLTARRDALRAEMDRNGIAYALVLTSYDVTGDRPDVETVLESVAAEPGMGVVVGIRHAHLQADLPGVRGLLEARRVKGLKLYPGYEPFELSEPAMRSVYELAAEFGVPVMIHTGDTYEPRAKVRFAHPLHVDDVAVEHRDVRFVICHIGNPWLLDAAEVIYKNENVFGDLSGFTVGDWQPRFERLMVQKVNEVIAYVNDPTKLMFGSDWPISDLGGYLRFLRRLDVTEEERDGILWRNAARVFGLSFEVRVEQADGGG